MERNHKRLWRAAVQIEQWVTDAGTRRHPVAQSANSAQRLQSLECQLAHALQQGLYRAANRLRFDLASQAEFLQRELSALAVRWRMEAQRPQPPRLADIYRDLWALEEEFGEIRCQPNARILSVCTSRIVLEEVDLGPFQIELEWLSSGLDPVYRVVALDPHPADQDASTTHPHVRDDSLCEGEGHSAIRAALVETRLYDFFLIVNRVLQTYAVGKAFIELEDWHGTRCSDCGCSVAAADECLCGRCESTLCADCRAYCSHCDDRECSSCLRTCACCLADCCQGCLQACEGCGQQGCPDCLRDDICMKCRNQGDDNDDDDASDGDSAAPAADDHLSSQVPPTVSSTV